MKTKTANIIESINTRFPFIDITKPSSNEEILAHFSKRSAILFSERFENQDNKILALNLTGFCNRVILSVNNLDIFDAKFNMGGILIILNQLAISHGTSILDIEPKGKLYIRDNKLENLLYLTSKIQDSNELEDITVVTNIIFSLLKYLKISKKSFLYDTNYHFSINNYNFISSGNIKQIEATEDNLLARQKAYHVKHVVKLEHPLKESTSNILQGNLKEFCIAILKAEDALFRANRNNLLDELIMLSTLIGILVNPSSKHNRATLLGKILISTINISRLTGLDISKISTPLVDLNLFLEDISNSLSGVHKHCLYGSLEDRDISRVLHLVEQIAKNQNLNLLKCIGLGLNYVGV